MVLLDKDGGHEPDEIGVGKVTLVERNGYGLMVRFKIRRGGEAIKCTYAVFDRKLSIVVSEHGEFLVAVKVFLDKAKVSL